MNITNEFESDFLANKSFMDKINQQQREADITRIKHGSLTRHYVILAEAFHAVSMIFLYGQFEYQHNSKSFKTCQSEVCKSNRDVIEKVGSQI